MSLIISTPEISEDSSIASLSGNEITNVLLNVSSKIRAKCSIDDLFHYAVTCIGEAGIADEVFVFQVNKSKKQAILTHSFMSPYSLKMNSFDFMIDLHDMPLIGVFKDKNTFQIQEIEKYLSLSNKFFKNKYKAFFLKLRIKSFLVSCGSNKDIRTIICLSSSTRNVIWTNEIEKFVQALADQLASAIDQYSVKIKKDNLQKNIIKIQEKAIQEKEELLRRFASDVHDLPCSMIPLLRDSVRKKDFQESERLIDELYSNLRQLINEYIVPDQDLVSFGSAIYQYVNSFRKNFCGSINIDLPDDEIGLSRIQSVELFKVIKEWFCNIKKHSQATQVSLRIKKINTLTYVIEIVDNGIGFYLEEKILQGYGLLNIRQRLKRIKARHEIKSKPNKGSSLIIQVSVDS